MSYNGGCVVAMKGKDCVAIATDHRFGIQVKFENLQNHPAKKNLNSRSFLGTNDCNKLRESISSEQAHVLGISWSPDGHNNSLQAIDVPQEFV